MRLGFHRYFHAHATAPSGLTLADVEQSVLSRLPAYRSLNWSQPGETALANLCRRCRKPLHTPGDTTFIALIVPLNSSPSYLSDGWRCFIWDALDFLPRTLPGRNQHKSRLGNSTSYRSSRGVAERDANAAHRAASGRMHPLQTTELHSPHTLV